MNDRLQHILAVHLDPRTGSPYWLERERELGFSLRDEIRCVADLARLGPFDLNALRERPVTDFMPSHVAEHAGLVFAETGGASGIPATTAYTADDFDAAFVRPFIDSVDPATTFTGGYWLWLGPGGPHVIGKAARCIAERTTGADAFSIDFDPRWYRRLQAGSIARSRYLEHVLEQAERIVRQQDIRYLFCTPVVLHALLPRLASTALAAIRFVYLGGMPVAAAALSELARALPAAVFFSGYGNTLFGVTHELGPGRPDGDIRRYYPRSGRLHIRVVAPPSPDLSPAERLFRDVAPGARGQVVMSRLDESCLLANVMERDDAERLPPAVAGLADGIGDPQPPANHTLKIDHGIY